MSSSFAVAFVLEDRYAGPSGWRHLDHLLYVVGACYLDWVVVIICYCRMLRISMCGHVGSRD
jgi:hypothetical protein